MVILVLIFILVWNRCMVISFLVFYNYFVLSLWNSFGYVRLFGGSKIRSIVHFMPLGNTWFVELLWFLWFVWLLRTLGTRTKFTSTWEFFFIRVNDKRWTLICFNMELTSIDFYPAPSGTEIVILLYLLGGIVGFFMQKRYIVFYMLLNPAYVMDLLQLDLKSLLVSICAYIIPCLLMVGLLSAILLVLFLFLVWRCGRFFSLNKK